MTNIKNLNPFIKKLGKLDGNVPKDIIKSENILTNCDIKFSWDNGGILIRKLLYYLTTHRTFKEMQSSETNIIVNTDLTIIKEKRKTKWHTESIVQNGSKYITCIFTNDNIARLLFINKLVKVDLDRYDINKDLDPFIEISAKDKYKVEIFPGQIVVYDHNTIYKTDILKENGWIFRFTLSFSNDICLNKCRNINENLL